MGKIFNTIDGPKDEATMYWDFIKSVNLTKEFELWSMALEK